MANIYTWTIENMATQLQLDSYSDVVIEVGWSCTGTDDTYYAIVQGLTRVTFAGGSDFTPYADLTQDQVLGWIWTAGVDKVNVELDLASQIELQVNPPVVVLPLPWV
jgi:hypothetical protein